MAYRMLMQGELIACNDESDTGDDCWENAGGEGHAGYTHNGLTRIRRDEPENSRYLLPGETTASGDQYLDSGGVWCKIVTGAHGRVVEEKFRLRFRRVEPAPGWRILAVGEFVEPGDQVAEWHPVASASPLLNRGGSGDGVSYRRRVGVSDKVKAGQEYLAALWQLEEAKKRIVK